VRTRAPLVAILAVAAVVRYWAINFCLPGLLCRPDEEAVAGIATHFFTRDLNPHFFDWPTLFFYETAAGLVAYFKVGLLLGWFRGEYHFFQTIVADPSPVFLTARLLSATAGVASVWVLARVGRRLFGERTALIAALFLALAFLHVRDSHFGVTDVTATSLLLVSFLFIVRFSESSRTRDLIIAAVAAGLATSTKYNVATVALPALWAVFAPTDASSGGVSARLGRAALFAAVMVLAFALTSPYCFLEYAQFIAALRGVSAHLAAGHGVILGRGWVVHLTSSLRYGLGLPLLAAGLTGLFLLAWKHGRKGILIALFPVTYYVVIGSGYTVFARYILPVVPFLCLTAAFAVSEAGRSIAAWSRGAGWAPATTWVLALLVAAPSAWSVVQFDRLIARTDSRVLAARWVELRFPEGANIAEVGRRSTNLFFLPDGPFTPTRYKTTMFTADATMASDPDILMVPTSLFDPGAGIPPRAAALVARYTPLHVVEAHDLSAKGAVYDWQDEFYLPLTGFAVISRPGPNLTIYVRPDLARGRP
jgi:4-amino-4-deoxy-L-arabinose transferase-like glycosyltransferase